MTKKDYELFAQVIRERLLPEEHEVKDKVLEICCTAFSRDNYLFDSDKFCEAVTTGKHIRKAIKQD